MAESLMMTLEELRQRIRASAELSHTHQQIAEFLSDHMREVSIMSAQELADKSGVSQASVTRFCTSLGYSGFGQFIRNLHQLMREEWHADQRTVFLRPGLSSNADPFLAQEIDNLEHLPDLLDSPEVMTLADQMATAQKIVLAGARISATLIPYAAYCLSKIRDDILVATPGQLLWDTASITLGPHDLVLAWVFPRYPAVLLDWLGNLKGSGVPIAAFTDRWISPACDITDPTIIVPVASASLFDGYSAPMFLINALTRKVAELIPDIHHRLSALESQDLRQNIYWARNGKKGEDV